MAQLAGAIEYTDCTSAEGNTSQTSVQYMTLIWHMTAILELWGMWSIPSLPSLPGPLQPGAIVPDRVLSMGQIELNSVLMLN